MNLFKSQKKEKAVKPPRASFLSFSEPAVLTTISMDENWVKIMRARGKPGKRKIDLAWSEPIKDLDEDQIAALIKSRLYAKGFVRSDFTISHPSHLTRARALRLPSIHFEELKTMVDLQVEKHTPDAKEETLTYFRIMERDAQGYSNVFLVMAHQDAVARSARIVQRLGGRFISVGSDIEGLIHWYRQIQKASKEKVEDGTLVIDIDNDYATLLIFHGAEPYYHRTIPFKVETAFLQDATGDALGHFLSEVHRSLMAYDEEGFKPPCARIILTGEAVKLEASLERIQKEMNMPAMIIPAALGTASNGGEAEAQQGSFAALFGFLSGSVGGDLTPSAMRMRQIFQKKVHAASLLVTQVLFGLLLISGFLIYRIQQDSAYLNLLKSKTEQMEKPAGKLELTLEHLKVVKGELAKHGALLDALVVIKEATPPEVRWNDMTYIEGESLLIKGVSRQIAKVFEMVTTLEKSPLFIKPEARRVTKRRVDDKDVTDFELVLPFAGAE